MWNTIKLNVNEVDWEKNKRSKQAAKWAEWENMPRNVSPHMVLYEHKCSPYKYTGKNSIKKKFIKSI